MTQMPEVHCLQPNNQRVNESLPGTKATAGSASSGSQPLLEDGATAALSFALCAQCRPTTCFTSLLMTCQCRVLSQFTYSRMTVCQFVSVMIRTAK